MDQSPMPTINSSSEPSDKSNSATRKAWLDDKGPYIPIFECRTGSSNLLPDYQSPPPPRPPKPSSWKVRSKSESCSSLPSSTLDSKINSGDGHDKHNSNFDFPYDFPKKKPLSVYNLRTHVPVRNTTAKSTLSYDNGVHVVRNKPEIFTYDYLKPVLPCFGDVSHLTFESDTLDPSTQPSTPNSAHDSLSSNGSYSKSTTPPAVNRDLKPRRKGSDSDMNSPASPTFKLSPPPSQSNYNVAISRPQSVKPRTEPPPVPCRNRQSLNNRDFSNVNDDSVNISSTISRRNLSHDEQSLRSNSVPRRSCDPNSVTYLDLDLDSDSKSSSHKLSNKDYFKADLNYTAPKIHPHPGNQSPCVTSSQSTVYKKIDFIATDALRRLQIGLGDSHRTS